MESPHFCTFCGHNIRPPEVITDGPFSYDGEAVFTVNGQRLRLGPQPVIAIGTIMQAKGRVVSRELLAERIGYGGENHCGYVAVIVAQTRAALRSLHAPDPIEGVYKMGYRWSSGTGRDECWRGITR